MTVITITIPGTIEEVQQLLDAIGRSDTITLEEGPLIDGRPTTTLVCYSPAPGLVDALEAELTEFVCRCPLCGHQWIGACEQCANCGEIFF